MIISWPAQIAVCKARIEGALLVLVAVQESVPASYLPPVLKGRKPPLSPPQMIISRPVQAAV